MTVPAILILFGAMLLYGGWTNRSVWALARGDNTTAKDNGEGITASPFGGAVTSSGGGATGASPATTSSGGGPPLQTNPSSPSHRP